MLLITLVTLLAFRLPLIGTQAVDPTKIDDATKAKWCDDQKSSCPLLCLQLPGASGKPRSNECSDSSLAYTCVCSNGQQPDTANFSQTIPFYECQQAANDCVNRCNTADSACQSTCRTANPCGAQNPTRINTTSSSTMSATGTDGAAATGSDGAATTSIDTGGFGSQSTGSSKAPRTYSLLLDFGGIYSLVIVLGCMTGGFMIML